jgi:putative lipoic acid-binding regulatory protein
MAEQETLIEFPCEFPIKIMGETRDGFAEAVVEAVRRHDAGFDGARVEMRGSSSGKYLSLTCTVNATSRAQLDDIYRELTAHPWVKIVL